MHAFCLFINSRGFAKALSESGAHNGHPTTWILDTSAILNGAWSAHAATAVTPPGVAGEFTPGGRTWAQYERLVAAGMKIEAPNPEVMEATRQEAKKLGETRLSEPDLETAALAAQKTRAGERVRVVTDDYSLQNLLTHLGLPWQGAREKGIQQIRRYRLRCTGCGRWFDPQGSQKAGSPCPICGSPVERKRARH